MTRCLIGHTGFVGGNLARAHAFDEHYNSKNFREMTGKRFDLVVCAGVSAVKWLANREPERDWAGIAALLEVLETVQAERFVLISTVDVLPAPLAADEATAIDPEGGQPYGRHRFAIERFVAERWADHLILRLPGMFGPGLRKNALYDLLHDNQVENIDPDGVFQFYDVRWTWADAERARARGLRLLHLATAPLRLGDLAERHYGRALPPRPGPHARYDLRSRHAAAWGRDDGYLYGAAQVEAALADWLASERSATRGEA
jgi:nucleoside-diphosphate-sugar epimerase